MNANTSELNDEVVFETARIRIFTRAGRREYESTWYVNGAKPELDDCHYRELDGTWSDYGSAPDRHKRRAYAWFKANKERLDKYREMAEAKPNHYYYVNLGASPEPGMWAWLSEARQEQIWEEDCL